MSSEAIVPPNLAYFGFGVTRHKRRWPKENSFVVGSVFLRLPMRTLFQHGTGSQASSRLALGLFGLNKTSPIAFSDRDHFERSKRSGSALAALDKMLLEQGITSCTGDAAGEVWLHTFPRVLGYAFKPVSFWFCYDKGNAQTAAQLRAVVAEVHNTFGEQHCYLLHHADGSPLVDGQEIVAQKMFHVSPFFPVRGEYRFRWYLGQDKAGATCGSVNSLNPIRSVIRIDYMDREHNIAKPDDITLFTSISGQHVRIGFGSTLRVLFGYPLNAMMVVFRIHLQALRLLCKSARFYRLPSKPSINVTHSQ